MRLQKCYKKILPLLMTVCVLGAGIGAGISVQGAENDDYDNAYGRYQTDDEYDELYDLFFVNDDDEYVDEMYMEPGDTEYLFLGSEPEDAWLDYEDSIIWESTNPGVASVDSDGEVTAKRGGITTIYAVWEEDETIYAQCEVTVMELKLQKTSFNMNPGEKAQIRVKSIYPKDDDVYYESSNEKIATVSNNGKITAVKTGKTVITAETDSGIKVRCQVNVKKAVATKKLKIKKNLTLAKGTRISMKAKRVPANASDKLTWKSSNSRVASVDRRGNVVAKTSGKAVITVKAASGKKASCTVLVTEVKLEKTSAVINVGASTKIKIKSSGSNKDKVVSYKSSNEKVATVDKKGTVKGRKAGKANISIKMKSGATAVFKVTVK